MNITGKGFVTPVMNLTINIILYSLPSDQFQRPKTKLFL